MQTQWAPGNLAAVVALAPERWPGTRGGRAVPDGCCFPHPGPSREECIHCAAHFHFQDWRCVPACGEGYYPEEMPGLPHRVCRRYVPGVLAACASPGVAGARSVAAPPQGAGGWVQHLTLGGCGGQTVHRRGDPCRSGLPRSQASWRLARLCPFREYSFSRHTCARHRVAGPGQETGPRACLAVLTPRSRPRGLPPAPLGLKVGSSPQRWRPCHWELDSEKAAGPAQAHARPRADRCRFSPFSEGPDSPEFGLCRPYVSVPATQPQHTTT